MVSSLLICMAAVNTAVDMCASAAPLLFLSSVRCELNMNHGKDAIPHRITGSRCKYSHHYDNKVYLCKVQVQQKLSKNIYRANELTS